MKVKVIDFGLSQKRNRFECNFALRKSF